MENHSWSYQGNQVHGQALCCSVQEDRSVETQVPTCDAPRITALPPRDDWADYKLTFITVAVSTTRNHYSIRHYILADQTQQFIWNRVIFLWGRGRLLWQERRLLFLPNSISLAGRKKKSFHEIFCCLCGRKWSMLQTGPNIFLPSCTQYGQVNRSMNSKLAF